jgi:hypothetical protein
VSQVFAPPVGYVPYLGDRELDEDDKPPVSPTVVFLCAEPEKPVKTENSVMPETIKAAEKAAASNNVKVRVRDNYRVLHESKPYVGGETLELPMSTAANWIKNGWVEPVTPKGTK